VLGCLVPDDYMVKPFTCRAAPACPEICRDCWSWTGSTSARGVGGGYNVNLEDACNGPRGDLQLTALEGNLLDALTSSPPGAVTRRNCSRTCGDSSESKPGPSTTHRPAAGGFEEPISSAFRKRERARIHVRAESPSGATGLGDPGVAS